MADDACARQKARAEALRYEPGDELTGAYGRFVSTRYMFDYTVPVMGAPDVPCECSICTGARHELMDYVRALHS